MAVFLNDNVGLKINSIDLSDHVKSITLTRNFDELEVTAMGDTAHRFVKGLEASTLQVDFYNDDATTPTNSVMATLQSAWGTTVPFTMIQTKGTAVSASNPLYTGTLLINHTTDINGDVAVIGMQQITFTINGATTVSPTGSF
jgi:hypothetical protein